MLDSFALIAFYNRESGFEAVKSMLQQARQLRQPLLMNEVNVGEVFYMRARKASLAEAERFRTGLTSLPITLVSNAFDDVIEAARLKAQYPISYGDAFAVATAVRMNALVVTGDPEFQAVRHLVQIQWIVPGSGRR